MPKQDRRPAVLRVGKGRHADVTSALRSARPGDVIEIEPGTYAGEIVIDKPVEVRPKRGVGTVVLTALSGNTVMILADAAVRDLTIEGNGWSGAAVEIVGSGVAPQIVNCVIRAPGSTGVRVRSGADPLLEDCRIGEALHGLRVESAGGSYERCAFSDIALETVAAALGATPSVVDCTFSRLGGHAAVALDPGTILTLGNCDIEGGTVSSVRASDGGQVTVTDCRIHGGGPALEVDADGVLHADATRIADTASEGILVSGGEGVFRTCRITGTHGPAVWMTAGRARFDQCEAIDSDRGGYLVVGGEAEFVRCVAHNNADQGFSLYTTVSLAECDSFGNGRPDEVGPREPDPEVTSEQREPPPAAEPRAGQVVRRVGGIAYPTITEAVDAANAGDVIEIEPGTYTENIYVDKQLEIRPAGEPGSVCLKAADNGVTLEASVTVRDIIMLNDDKLMPAVTVRDKGTQAVLERCEISAAGWAGVSVTDEAGLTMIGCTVSTPAGAGVSVLQDSAVVVDLRECVIAAGKDNAVALHGGSLTIRNVTTSGGLHGLMVINGTVEATGLKITNPTEQGIDLSGSKGAFTHCEITGAGGHGVAVFDGTAVFEDCEAIGGRQNGFWVVDAVAKLTRCVARENRLKGFETEGNVKLAECASYDNKVEDEVGIQPRGAGPHVLPVKSFTELKQALRNAAAGDTVEIEPGKYQCNEQIHIRQGVKVRSAQGTGTVRLAVGHDPIMMAADSTLREITVSAGQFNTAVIVPGDANSAVIEGCQLIARDGIAVKVTKGATPTLRDCTIGPAEQGLVLRRGGGRYERCEFTNIPEPVVVNQSDSPYFEQCKIIPGKGKRVTLNRKDDLLLLRQEGRDTVLTGTIAPGGNAIVRADKPA